MSLLPSQDYLVRHGLMGDISRFRADGHPGLVRGDRVVVRGERGLEMGEIVRAATAGHPGGSQAPALERRATSDDETRARQHLERAAALLGRARTLAAEMSLPLEPIEAEILFDGSKAIVYALRWAEADLRRLLRVLSREGGQEVEIADLSGTPVPAKLKSGCGGCSSGGCSSGGCSSGGCSSGGCGSKAKKAPRPVAATVPEETRRVSLL